MFNGLEDTSQIRIHNEKSKHFSVFVVTTSDYFRLHVLRQKDLHKNDLSTLPGLDCMRRTSWFLLMRVLWIGEQLTVVVHGQFEVPRRSVKHFLYVVDGEFIFVLDLSIIADHHTASQFSLRCRFATVFYIVM